MVPFTPTVLGLLECFFGGKPSNTNIGGAFVLEAPFFTGHPCVRCLPLRRHQGTLPRFASETAGTCGAAPKQKVEVKDCYIKRATFRVVPSGTHWKVDVPETV